MKNRYTVAEFKILAYANAIAEIIAFFGSDK